MTKASERESDEVYMTCLLNYYKMSPEVYKNLGLEVRESLLTGFEEKQQQEKQQQQQQHPNGKLRCVVVFVFK